MYWARLQLLFWAVHGTTSPFLVDVSSVFSSDMMSSWSLWGERGFGFFST